MAPPGWDHRVSTASSAHPQPPHDADNFMSKQPRQFCEILPLDSAMGVQDDAAELSDDSDITVSSTEEEVTATKDTHTATNSPAELALATPPTSPQSRDDILLREKSCQSFTTTPASPHVQPESDGDPGQDNPGLRKRRVRFSEPPTRPRLNTPALPDKALKDIVVTERASDLSKLEDNRRKLEKSVVTGHGQADTLGLGDTEEAGSISAAARIWLSWIWTIIQVAVSIAILGPTLWSALSRVSPDFPTLPPTVIDMPTIWQAPSLVETGVCHTQPALEGLFATPRQYAPSLAHRMLNLETTLRSISIQYEDGIRVQQQDMPESVSHLFDFPHLNTMMKTLQLHGRIEPLSDYLIDQMAARPSDFRSAATPSKQTSHSSNLLLLLCTYLSPRTFFNDAHLCAALIPKNEIADWASSMWQRSEMNVMTVQSVYTKSSAEEQPLVRLHTLIWTTESMLAVAKVAFEKLKPGLQSTSTIPAFQQLVDTLQHARNLTVQNIHDLRRVSDTMEERAWTCKNVLPHLRTNWLCLLRTLLWSSLFPSSRAMAQSWMRDVELQASICAQEPR